MNLASHRTGILILTGVVAACSAAVGPGESVGATTQATGTCAIPVIVGQSLFVAPVVTTYDGNTPTNTNNAAGAAALKNFKFKTVMEQIVTSGGVQNPDGAGAAALALYQQLVGTLNSPTCTGTINGFPVDCPSEGQIATTNPFTGDGGDDIMTAVALVNRFDLAPDNGANCGQYRIVFAINPNAIEFAGRFLMIFEAVLPNPNPSLGLAACLPVAQFWDNLSAVSLSSDDFASQLKTFYFDGLPASADGGAAFAPVIQAQNYGIGAPENTNTGQIRLNMLSDTTGDWELREFKLAQSCPDGGGGCTLTGNNTFVANNPYEGLFATGGGAKFQKEFISQVQSLAATTIPLISMTTPNADNGGESDESDQFQLNDYRKAANGNTALTTAIQGELTQLNSSLTPTDILNRATTQSCAGCHELSPGTNLGGGLTWPQSNGFVQVDESGQQSQALANDFLPFRASVLTTFIDDNCAGGVVSGDGTRTVGGGAVGGAN